VHPYWELPHAPTGLAEESRPKQAKKAQICQEYLFLPTGVGRGHPIYMTKLRRRPVVDLDLVALHPVVLHPLALENDFQIRDAQRLTAVTVGFRQTSLL
jgi:hypothetical protein